MTESATVMRRPEQRPEWPTPRPERRPEPAQPDARDVGAGPREQNGPGEPVEDREISTAEVMRPAWVQSTKPRSHQPYFTELPTQGMLLLPRSRAGIATVVVTRRAGTGLLGSSQAPSRWSLFWERGTLYEIDLGLHHTASDVELPSAVDTFSFHAHVTVEWRVVDPVKVVKDHVRDVREALAPALVGLLALDTRRFRVDEVYDAERAVAETLDNNDIGGDYGLETTLRVQLSADSGAAEHAASRRALQQMIEMEELRYSHRMRLEATEEKVIRARIELYREIISAGDVEQFALQLARNPESVETVVRMVREVRQEEHRHVTDFLTRLLDEGVIDRWEVKDTVQTALDWLKESNDRVVQTGEARLPWQGSTSYADRGGSNGSGSANGNGNASANGSANGNGNGSGSGNANRSGNGDGVVLTK